VKKMNKRGWKPRIVILALAALLQVASAADLAAQDAPDPVALFNAGKFAEAAAALEPLAQSNPNEPGVHYLLGRSYLKLDRTPDAVRALGKAVELKPDQFEYEFWLANAHLQAKDWPNVIAVLDKAEARVPDDTYRFALRGMRGYASLVLEKYPEAIRDFEANLAAKKNAGTLVSLGKALYAVKEYERSAAAFREATQIEPNETGTWLLLGNAELALAVAADGDAAKAHYAEALKAADRYVAAKADGPGLQLKAKAALALGDSPAAEAALTQALQIDPNNCQAQSQLGRAYVDQKKWAEAERALQGATRCDPNNGPAHEALGFVYLSTDKLNDALQAYQKAHSINPTPSSKEGIAAVNARMQMQAANAEATADKAAWEAKRRQHEKEYQEYLKKREEWEKKRNNGN
jgi:tetratricopeptide (TPR) repeat protein